MPPTHSRPTPTPTATAHDGHDTHDHDLGLAHDLPRLRLLSVPAPPAPTEPVGSVTDRIMDRRASLKLLGGAGLGLALVACGGGSSDTSATSSTVGSTAAGTATTAAGSATTAASGELVVVPEETAGPFPGDGSNGPDALGTDGVVRSDITTSFGSASGTAEGVPLTITLTMKDSASNWAPLAGAAVYLWHADRDGKYSLYSEGVTDQNYLRGVQESDDAGAVTFRTIFPGCYDGRWPHMHFQVFPDLGSATSATATLVTSQIAFPEDSCVEAYAADGYETSVDNLSRISIAQDMVFSDDGGVLEMATVTGDVDSGFVATLTIGV